MTPPLQIKVSQDAKAQIEEAAAWWAGNRPLVPDAVRQDLDRILGLLSVNPGLDALEVLAFWHTSRGRQPNP